ncbi:hypothetical protein [Halorubrum halodurans]|uniref:hypothetical protein n=1 Tax=Halorubrum halodurans TaxID=1383851 RepID=UPI000B99052F|nr:hypothetical protein [Halorubrum halodurans]
MGLLTALREWIAGLLGGSEAEDANDAPDDGTAGSAPDDPDAGAADRLDPGAVTETRSTATDDAVDKLREVRRAAPERAGDDEDAAADASAENAPSTENAPTDGDAPTDAPAGDGKR